MLVTDVIDPFWFTVAFCVGMFMVYCMSKNPDLIIKYPTPENAHTTVFQDDTDNCYRFKTTEVDCPRNPFSIHVIPVQRKIEYFDSDKDSVSGSTPPQSEEMTRKGYDTNATYPFTL